MTINILLIALAAAIFSVLLFDRSASEGLTF